MKYANSLFFAILSIALLSSCEDATLKEKEDATIAVKLVGAAVSSECTKGVKLSCLADVYRGTEGVGPLKHCTDTDLLELLHECLQLINDL